MRAEMGKQPSRAPPSQLQLPPGFRFYPSDEELVIHYLCKKAASEPFSVPIIAEVELYKFDPWVLPDKALFGEKEWYFFSPRDRKYPNGSRPNRAAGSGYWKATGTDKPISALNGSKKVGVKKALVFYKGKAPKGVKTNWIMHEYRLADSGAKSAKRKGSLRLDDWVLCRIYKKSSSALKAAKDQRCEASCQEDVLSFLPEIDVAEIDIPRLNSSSTKGFVGDHEQGVEKPNMDFYQQQVQMLQTHEVLPRTTDAAVAVDIAGNSYRGSEESSQGASSLELSHWSNELSRQNSPPDSVVEDDSVESTFNSIPSLISTNQFLGNLPHPIFNFDGLPSPFGRLETFPPLGDGDYFNFTPDYSYFPRSIS